MMDLAIASLATFGIAVMLSEKDGPFDILLRLRSKFKLLECTVCISFWVALVVLAMLALGWSYITWTFAVVGAVVLLDRLS